MLVKDEAFIEELIEQLADPILDTLLSLQEEMGDDYLDRPFTVHLESPDLQDSQFSVNGMETGSTLPPEFMQMLEAYIQKRLDEWNRPTILH